MLPSFRHLVEITQGQYWHLWMAAAGNMYSSTGGYGNTMTAIGKGINSHPTGISINLLAILDDSGIASQ
jgi:hypothetical protein